MMADELLNVQDLIAAKKHDTFHSEVVTGKAGGLSTGANIDYATNAVTGQVQKTLPATVNGIDWSYIGKFADGVTFTKKSDFAIDSDGVQWIYTGSLPFSATAGTAPSEPTYQVVHVGSLQALSGLAEPSDLAQRHRIKTTTAEIATGVFKPGALLTVSDRANAPRVVVLGGTPDGSAIIDAGNGNTAVLDIDSVIYSEWFATITDAYDFATNNANQATPKRIANHLVIGDKPLPFNASDRDAYQVARYLDSKTDCHAFADKTTISNATDAGTYGTFDSQTEVAGSHAQDHQFSFQDRAIFSGSGTLTSWGNIIWPVMSGSGTVNNRHDIEIQDPSGVGGTINSHIGVYIKDLQRAATNVAINVQQSSGFSVYSPNAGKWQIGGNFAIDSGAMASFGTLTPIAGVPVTFKSTGSTRSGFLASDTSSANFGVSGDYGIALVANADKRIVLENSSNAYTFRPNSDNAQLLGRAAFRWSTVYAGTGTINTSDEREKTSIEAISEAEKAAALEIKSRIGKFKFISAINDKGDGARIHIGVGAQTVMEIMHRHGLDAHKYAFFCHDEWGDEFDRLDAVYDDNGNEIEKGRTLQVQRAGDRYGIRYDELSMFILASI